MENCPRKPVAQLLLLALALSAVTGCSTYNQKNRFAQYWERGDLASAEREATARADKEANGKDAIIWRLEQGAILRAAGKYAESNAAFDQAQEKIDQYAEEAKTKVGSEIGAMVSNQANLPYRGRAYDGIMLNTYKALNYLALGEPDKARVEIIRAYQRQQDAVEDNKRRIEKAQEDLESQKEKERIRRAESDPQVQGRLSQAYSGLDSMEVYADYVNPFTVYLDGLIYLAQATGPSDLERARKSFERVASFAPNNQFVKADLESAETFSGAATGGVTYVIFENGRAPIRDQIRIDIPILVSRLSYVGAAFPTLQTQGGQLSALRVVANGTNETTQPLASMDSVIGQDFKNELPAIITKTIASTVIKAAASYAANEAAHKEGGELAGLLSQIGTAVFQIAVNIADLRTWSTLPKEYQICRLTTPPDRRIELEAVGSGQKVSVTLEEGAVNLVFVKSIAATGPLFVSQMKLK